MPDLNTTNDQSRPESMRSKIWKRLKQPSLIKKDINDDLTENVEKGRLEPALAAGASAVSDFFLPDSVGEIALSAIPIGGLLKKASSGKQVLQRLNLLGNKISQAQKSVEKSSPILDTLLKKAEESRVEATKLYDEISSGVHKSNPQTLDKLIKEADAAEKESQEIYNHFLNITGNK